MRQYLWFLYVPRDWFPELPVFFTVLSIQGKKEYRISNSRQDKKRIKLVQY